MVLQWETQNVKQVRKTVKVKMYTLYIDICQQQTTATRVICYGLFSGAAEGLLDKHSQHQPGEKDSAS